MTTQLNMETVMSLQGQVGLVTGGGTGIGLMIAKAFATNGAKVYITGRREAILFKAVEGYEGKLIPLVLDVTSQESIESAVETINSKEGKLDILVNNAGVGGPSDPEFFKNKYQNFLDKKDPLEFETSQIWATVFDTNISAPFFVTRAFVDLLTKGAEARKGTSSVINISSVVADLKMLITAMSIAYAASKSALEKIAIGLAADFANRKIPIRVNTIRSGHFASEMNWMAGGAIEIASPGLIAPPAARRGGTEEEMGMSAMYLAASEYTNGATVLVDGGMWLTNA